MNWGDWIESRFYEIPSSGLREIIEACKRERRRRYSLLKERKVTYSQQKRGNNLYWYAYWTDPKTGKKKSKYIGKDFKEIQINMIE